MKSLILLVLLSISSILSNAQQHSITAMHHFMQVNADTTIILSYSSGWLSPQRYMAISKKGDTLTCYQHKPIDDIPVLSKVKVPSMIMRTVFSKRLWEPVTVDGEFHLVVLDEQTIREFWVGLLQLNLWNLRDDVLDGQHCPPEPPGEITIDNRIIDSSTIHLDLITKSSIKALAFYDPAHYEKICPSRPGRVAMLKIEELFIRHMNRF